MLSGRLDGAQLLLWDTKSTRTPKLLFRARLNSNMKQEFLLGSSEYSAYEGDPKSKNSKCATYTTDDESRTYNTFKDLWLKGDGVGSYERYVGPQLKKIVPN